MLEGEVKHTCVICGHIGEDVSEYPLYDKGLKRDSTAFMCDDVDACLERSLPEWYRRQEELVK